MSTVHFPAIIERGGAATYGVFFPDLPGCVSAGDSIQSAATNAEIALNLHLAGMIEDGEAIPAPTPLDHVAGDPEVHEVARVLVRGEIPERAMRVNITLHAQVLAVLDALSATRNLDRSSMIAALVRDAGRRKSTEMAEEWPALMRTYKRLRDTDPAEAAIFWRQRIEPAVTVGSQAQRGETVEPTFKEEAKLFKAARRKPRARRK